MTFSAQPCLCGALDCIPCRGNAALAYINSRCPMRYCYEELNEDGECPDHGAPASNGYEECGCTPTKACSGCRADYEHERRKDREEW